MRLLHQHLFQREIHFSFMHGNSTNTVHYLRNFLFLCRFGWGKMYCLMKRFLSRATELKKPEIFDKFWKLFYLLRIFGQYSLSLSTRCKINYRYYIQFCRVVFDKWYNIVNYSLTRTNQSWWQCMFAKSLTPNLVATGLLPLKYYFIAV